MDDPSRVRLRKAQRDLSSDVHSLVDGYRTSVDQILERITILEIHLDEHLSIWSSVDLVDRTNVWVV